MPKKILYYTIFGNILEYYDFLLFAHLGFIITPVFFTIESPTLTHLFSLFLFGLGFIARPIGGSFWGSLADRKGRKVALTYSMFWATLPTLGLVFLPSYALIGIIAPILFICFRLIQGIALGGENPNAGTYLMEYATTQKGFVSGVLAGSALLVVYSG